jgi:hypothetical protein
MSGPFEEDVSPQLVIEKLSQVPRRNSRGKPGNLVPKTYLREGWNRLRPVQQQKVIDAWKSMPADWRNFVVNSQHQLAQAQAERNATMSTMASNNLKRNFSEALKGDMAKAEARQARMKTIIETLKNVDILQYPESKVKALRSEYQALDETDSKTVHNLT